MRRIVVAFLVAAFAAFGLTVVAVPATAVSSDVNVPATAGGPDNGGTAAVSTGIEIPDGASVTIFASGTIDICGESGCENGPNGGNPGGGSTANSLVPFGPYGCLAARVGDGEWSCAGVDDTLEGPGELQFAVNDDFVSPGVGYEDNFGAFTVVVGQPTQRVSVTIRLTGAAPGVSLPVTVTCTGSSTVDITADAVADNKAGDLVLGDDDTESVTFSVPPLPLGSTFVEGPPYVQVWWPVSGVDNVTCTVSRPDLAVLPAGVTCAAAFVSGNTVVLYDLGDEIDQSASVEISLECSLPIEPTFTG